MGSGKGKTKRVQAIPEWRATHSMQPWDDFVMGQGIPKVPMVSYYLPGNQADELGIEDVLKVVTELFQDFTSVGMLNLPQGRSSDEYEFVAVRNEASPGTVNYNGGRENVALRDLRSNTQETLDAYPARWFTPDTLMSSWSVESLARALVQTLGSLAQK